LGDNDVSAVIGCGMIDGSFVDLGILDG